MWQCRVMAGTEAAGEDQDEPGGGAGQAGAVPGEGLSLHVHYQAARNDIVLLLADGTEAAGVPAGGLPAGDEERLR